MVDNTALGYLMATQDLDALAVEAELKDEGKKKPRPNNLEEVSEFVEQINEAVDKFIKTVHQYETYSIQDACSDFAGKYYKLLSKIEDYFVDVSPTAVLELVDDTTCKIMCVEKRARTMQRPQSEYRQYYAAPQGNEQVRGYAQFQNVRGWGIVCNIRTF